LKQFGHSFVVLLYSDNDLLSLFSWALWRGGRTLD
jgi:hypothetical protein